MLRDTAEFIIGSRFADPLAAPQDDGYPSLPRANGSRERASDDRTGPGHHSAFQPPTDRREVAYAALLLISNESSYVSGHTLFLDAAHMGGIVRG